MEKNTETVERNVHCPFCDCEKAFLLKKSISRSFSLQAPAYGLKYLLRLLFLFPISMFIYGFKFFDVTKSVEDVNYIFCPECGNSCSMEPSKKTIENPDQSLYKIRKGKKAAGVCGGISELTGYPVLWVRIFYCISALSAVPAIIYIFLALCLQFKEDEDNGTPKKLTKKTSVKKVFGVCAGVSEYLEINMEVIQLFGILLFPLYFMLAICLPSEANINAEK